MDWLDLLAVQGTLKSLLQHHGSKASILRHSASFIVQFSHLHMTIGKTIALTRWICWQYAFFLICCLGGLPWWLRRLSVCLQCGRPRFDPWVGKFPWRRKWQHTQYSCLEKPMDRGAVRLQSMGSQRVRGVAKSRTQLLLKLKLQYFGHLIRSTDSFEKTQMLGMIEGGRRRG